MTHDVKGDFVRGFREGLNGKTAISPGCLFFYIAPTILYFFLDGWYRGVVVVSIALGFWLSKPSRRWIAAISIACTFFPPLWVNLLGWVGGFWLTIELDGALKHNLQPPQEWE